MKVLHVVSSIEPALGGIVQCASQITAAMQSRNVQVTIVCLDDPSAPWVNKFPVGVIALGKPAIPIVYAPSIRLMRWLLANASKYNAIVVHGLWQFQTLAVARVARKTRIPYFVYLHGMLMRPAVHNSAIKVIKKFIYWQAVERRALENASATLCTSSQELSWSDHPLFKLEKKPVVLGNGLFFGGIPSIPQGRLRTAKPSLLIIGRLHPVKGIELLFESLTLLGEDAPDLFVAGRGDPESYEEKLKDMAKKLGIADRVRFTGHLDQTAKFELMSRVWGVISTSHHENFGFTIVESLAIATPVLLTRNIAICETVLSCNAGIAFDHDTISCAKAISKLSEMAIEDREVMSANAENCFLRHFDISPAADKLLSLIAAQDPRNKPSNEPI